jgi:type I restriction enzyme S subunit
MSKQERQRLRVDWIVPGTEVLGDGWTPSCLAKVLSQANRRVQVQSTERYARLGVRWYAAGPFLKEVAAGSEIKGKYLQSVRSGDFIYNRLFAWKGSFGVVSGEQDGCYVSDEFPVFEVDHDAADARFLWRWFSQPSVWNAIESWSSGSTRTSRLRFREPDLLNMVVPLPPLPEQRAIARVLRTVQEAIAATERVIEAAKELKRSMMEYLFTYGPVPVDRADQVELKETEIGAMPSSWNVVKMADCGTIVTGSTPSTRNTEYYGGQFPFYGPGDIQDAKTVGSAQKTLTKLGLGQARSLPRGTLLVVCIGGSIGKAALTAADASATNQQINALIPWPHLSNDYLYYAASKRSRALPALAGRAAIPIVNKAVFSKFTIPVAVEHEQHIIANMLNGVEGTLTALEQRHEALASLFDSLLHSLMTGKVRVTPTEQDMEASE